MKKFRWRFIVYAIAVIYLLGDLYLFKGPLRSRLDRSSAHGEAAKALARREGIVATVNGHPIRLEELDRAVGEYCLKRGLLPEKVSSKRMNAIRVLVINELVVDRLIWFYSQHYEDSLPELGSGAEVKSFHRAITDSTGIEEILTGQGFISGRLEKFLHNQAVQRAWIEKVIAEHIVVSEEEIQQRYEEEPEVSTLPERIRVRHIFITRQGKAKGRAESLIRVAEKRLHEGESFEKVAADMSEDTKSKANGGQLNWVTRDRVDKDFASAVFALNDGEVGQPFATTLGWHLAEVIERKPQVRVAVDKVRLELAAAIETEKRQAAVDALISSIKSKARIRYFAEFIWVE